jgi:hypothetical protein
MPLILDTLGWVYKPMERGMSREQAEAAAMATRDFIRDMEAAGMGPEEIKQRFAEIHDDLKRQRLEREAQKGTGLSGGVA